MAETLIQGTEHAPSAQTALPLGGAVDDVGGGADVIALTGAGAVKTLRVAGQGTTGPQRRAVLAPPPLIDRYPTLVGTNLTLTYLASVYRLALTGYRREYVDALGEILDRDPHLLAVMVQRVFTVAGGRISITPSDPTNRKAKKIAQEVDKRIRLIPDLAQSLATLLFSGLFYGIGACEIAWRYDKSSWWPTRLGFIHSRRLSYPDPADWELHIWDQGQLYPWAAGAGVDVGPTARMFGIRANDFPGKFVVCTPQLRADYPTREGCGRVVGIWSALKSMGARGAAQFIERFAKPWAIGTFATTPDGKPRAAEQGDVSAADAALRAIGAGSLAGVTLPDSVKLELQQVLSKGNITHKEWIDLCNAEESKGVLGQTGTTEEGQHGGFAAKRVMKTGSDQLARFDALTVASILKRDLVDWMVRYNWPADLDKSPNVAIIVDPDPDPGTVLDNAAKAVAIGAQVDHDKVLAAAGLPVIQQGDTEARVLVPVKPVDLSQVYPDRFEAPQIALPFGGGDPNDPKGGKGAPPGAPGAKGPPGKAGQPPKPGAKPAPKKKGAKPEDGDGANAKDANKRDA